VPKVTLAEVTESFGGVRVLYGKDDVMCHIVTHDVMMPADNCSGSIPGLSGNAALEASYF
jgi:hypothetical protein